jgi:hypothetical protein
MKTYILVLLHLIGLSFVYVSAGILIYWLFEFDMPFPEEYQSSVLLGYGTYLVLPLVGLISIWMNFPRRVGRAHNYIYLLFWITAIIQIISILLSK